jgi:hypothetical protein
MIDEMLNVAMLAAKWAGLPFQDFQTDMQDTEKGRRLSRLASHIKFDVHLGSPENKTAKIPILDDAHKTNYGDVRWHEHGGAWRTMPRAMSWSVRFIAHSNSAWHRRCRRLWTCPFGARADE